MPYQPKVMLIGRSHITSFKCKITETRKQKLKLKFYMILKKIEKEF